MKFRKNTFIKFSGLATLLSSCCALAQMPVVLLDNDGVANPEQWAAAAPLVQAALECRQNLNPDDPLLRPLLPANESGQWELVPPQGFSVFGLPVQVITLYIDPDGEMGASYSASLAATVGRAAQAAGLEKGERRTEIGWLMLGNGSRPSLTDITCTVIGSRDLE